MGSIVFMLGSHIFGDNNGAPGAPPKSFGFDDGIIMKKGEHGFYPLVNLQFAIENGHRNS